MYGNGVPTIMANTTPMTHKTPKDRDKEALEFAVGEATWTTQDVVKSHSEAATRPTPDERTKA